MRPAEPPRPAGAVSISCVGSPPGTARLLEVGELGKNWVVGGQSPPPARTRASCEVWFAVYRHPASGLDLGATPLAWVEVLPSGTCRAEKEGVMWEKHLGL